MNHNFRICRKEHHMKGSINYYACVDIFVKCERNHDSRQGVKLDKCNHNGGLYLQEGVLIKESIFLQLYRSNHLQSQEFSSEAGWHVNHQGNTSINHKKNTSVAHNICFRSDKYGCKTSPGPWQISTYRLLVYQTHELTRPPRPGNNLRQLFCQVRGSPETIVTKCVTQPADHWTQIQPCQWTRPARQTLKPL